jgi:hypothetical protein
MKKRSGVFSWMIIFGGMVLLMSCNFPFQPTIQQENQQILLKYSTVSALLTETAGVGTKAVSQVKPQVTSTFTLEFISFTRTPTPEAKPEVPVNKTVSTKSIRSGILCDLAQAGKPIDITIPDDTRLHPGEYFSKTWRLVNAGECTWTPNYAVVWFSGDELGLGSAQSFSNNVPPGDAVDVTMDMIAPLNPGTYQSNWKLRNDQGQLFGIGPQGDAPFWVKIMVIPLNTATITPTLPLATATPEIFASGTFALLINQKADLDNGRVEQPKGNDIAWKIIAGENPVISPEDGAQFALFGLTVPEMQDCIEAPMSDQVINLDQLQEGSFICYQTTAGLPGRVYISKLDLKKNMIDLDFVTWVVP